MTMERDAILEIWARYLEGRPISEQERKALEEVLEADPEILQSLRVETSMDALLRAAGQTAESEEFVGKVRDRLRPSGRRRRTAIRRRNAWVPLVAAASLLIVIGLLVWGLRWTDPSNTRSIAERSEAPPETPSPEPPAPKPPSVPKAPPAPRPEDPAPSEKSEPPITREAPKAPPTEPKNIPEPKGPEMPPPPRRETEPRKPVLRVVKIEGDLEGPAGQLPWNWPINSAVSAGRKHARMTLENGTRISLESGTVLEARQAAPPTLFLSRGSVFCEVPPSPEAPDAGVRLAIESRDGNVFVKGTEFGVKREGLKTVVAVRRGNVTAESSGEAVEVTAGHGTTFRARRAPETPEAMDAKKIFGWRYELDPERQILMTFDFEDGRVPDAWTLGRLVSREPSGDGFCLQAVDTPNDRIHFAVGLNPNLRYSAGLVLSFEYRVTGTDPGLRIQIHHKTQKQNYSRSIKDIVKGRWSRAVILFSEASPLSDKSLRMEEGDVLNRIDFLSSMSKTDSLEIDNVQFLRYRPDRIPGER